MTSTALPVAPATSRWAQFYALTKPRVVQLIVFCALIGMLLAQPGLPDLKVAGAAVVGIWLVAAAAAAFNCLVEQHIDRKMARTSWRPTAKGELTNTQTLLFSGALCGLGSLVLWVWVNPLTMWLTFATFVGYAVVLGLMFIHYAWQLWRHYSDALARKTFRFSIWHLSLLFAALLLDHYLGPVLQGLMR